jgi:deoxyribonuclease V
MRLPRVPHPWRLSPRQAIAVQRRLSARVRRLSPGGALRLVAGLDAAFSIDGTRCLAAVVLWDTESGRPIEEHLAQRPLRFPYIPGLLSFREAPALLAALRQLERAPDVLMCDGQGLAHPRRFGIACHLGGICDLPAVGCAKSRLTGQHAEPGPHRGDFALLREESEVLGAVVRTQAGAKPLYVSIGHRLDLEAARALVMRCTTIHRLPQPTWLADRLVAAARKRGNPVLP